MSRGDTSPVIRRPRRASSVVSTLALVVGLVVGVGVPASADDVGEVDDAHRAQAAATLLNRQARQFDEPIRTTVSSAYEYLMAFAAAGRPGAASPPGRAWYLLDALERRASFAEGSTTISPVTISGTATAAVTSFADVVQVVHAAAVYDQDPAGFAGRDFIAALAGFEFDGADPSWYRTTATGSSRATTQQQARAVLALSAAGREEKAAAAASSLAAKQLASGAWSTSYTGTAASFEHTVNAVAALAAEGSASSLAAADSGATYLIGLQHADGSFTGASTPVLVGQAANALRAAGRTEAAESAAAFVRALQVTGVDGVDPLFDGGIASTAAAKAQIEADTYAALSFGTLATNNLRAIYAFTPAIGSLHVDEPAGERPAVEGNDTFHPGACAGDEGVTMVVDYGYIAPVGKSEPAVSCALGTQASGWAALENAGVAVGSVPGFVGGALCQLDGVPVEGYPYCWLSEGYWSYWHAEPGEVWTYSQLGASNRAPEPGSVDGWRFVPLAGAGVPPRVGPTFAEGIDTTAPRMEFQTGPSGTVDGGAKWTFTWSLDDMGATLECRLDDADWEPCDEPESWDATAQRHTVRDVSNGDHVFWVRATDPWGNVASISRAFTVVTDANPPLVAITKTPGPLTNVTNAAFTMTVDDPDATVECRLDDADWTSCTSRTSQSYSGLGEGEHTFGYRATDLSGNVGSASHTWTIAVDAPPVVTITSTTTYTSAKTTASANFTIADAGTVTSRECRLDDGEWVACSSATQARWTGLDLTDGAHTIEVRATNDAGHTSEIATYTWYVDTVKPVVEVLTGPESTTTDRDARLGFAVTDASPIYTLTCDVDGSGAKPCSSPVELSGLSLGQHTVKIQARDMAFLYSDAVTVTWTVERDPATVAETAASQITEDGATIAARVEAGNVDQGIAVEVDGPGEATTTTEPQALGAGTEETLSFDLTGLESNTGYTARVVATSGDGEVVRGDPVEFTTAARRAALGAPSVGVVSPNAVTVTAPVTAGDLDQSVRAELSTKPDHSGAVSTGPTPVAASDDAVDVDFDLDGLAAGSDYSFRVVAEASDGTLLATDWSAFSTPAHAAPTVSLRATGAGVTVGATITLTWSARNAETVTASGGWSGDLDPTGGSRTVRITRPGTHVFTLEAAGAGGRTTATVRVDASLPAARLAVSAPKSPIMVGRPATVRVSGLATGEAYAVTIGGIRVASGTAGAGGAMSRSVTMPRALAAGTRTVAVTGSTGLRAGSAGITVVRAKKLGVSTSTKAVGRGHRIKVTVRGLAAGEPVTVRLLGKRHRGTANARGVFATRVKVTKRNAAKAGKKRVSAVGVDKARKGRTTFEVRAPR